MARILCAHQGFELYGSDKVFIQTVRCIQKNFPDCALTLHLPCQGELLNVLQDDFAPILMGRLWILRRDVFKGNFFKQVCLLVDSLKFCYLQVKNHDLIYISTNRVLLYIVLSIFFKKPFIIHVHEIENGVMRRVINGLLSCSRARLIANSRATAASLPQGKNPVVIYNGIQDQERVEKSKSIKGLNLLLIGRINHWKGHHLAIDALKILHDKGHKDISLRCVGSCFPGQEHYLTALNLKIHKLGLNDKVEVIPFSPETAPHFLWSDVALVPSTRPEPFGLVAIEAMRAGVPVIAADHGGLAEIVVPHETGLLVTPQQAQALAEAILFYKENQELIEQHGQLGRQRFLDLFLEETYHQAIIDLVDSYVNKTT